MREIMTLIKNNLRILMIKKPSYTVLMVVCPIICCMVFSQFIAGNDAPLKIGIVDNSNTVSSQQLVEDLEKNDIITIYKTTEDELKNKFTSRDVVGGIIINKDFQDKLLKGDLSGITINGFEEENIYEFLAGMIKGTLINFKGIALLSEGNIDKFEMDISEYKSTLVNVERKSLSDNDDDKVVSQALIGFLIMFAFYRALNGASLIGEDKRQEVYTRILTTTVKPWQYYISNVVSTLILVELQILLTLIGINIVSNINYGMTIGEMFIILSLGSTVAVSIGTFCLTITDNRDLSSIISNLITLPLLFLGGCFIPISMFPNWMERVSYFTPTRWVMQGVLEIQEGNGLMSIADNSLIITLFVASFLLISIYAVTRRDKVNKI